MSNMQETIQIAARRLSPWQVIGLVSWIYLPHAVDRAIEGELAWTEIPAYVSYCLPVETVLAIYYEDQKSPSTRASLK